MASGGTSYIGDGNTFQASVTGGWGDFTKDKWNVMLNANYYKRQEILSRSREYAKTEDLRNYASGTDGRSSYGTPGTLIDIETGERAYPGGCGPESQISGSSLRGGFCRYDRPLYSGLYPETQRYGFFGQGQYNFSPEIQAFVEGNWARQNYFSTGFAAPTLDGYSADPFLNPATGAGLIVPVGDPFNPFPNPAELRLRTIDVGTRDTSQTSEIWRVVAGMKGTVKGWDWDAAYYQSEVSTDLQNLNQVLQTEFQKYLNNGLYNIANPLANPASVTNALRYTALRTGSSTLKDVAGKLSGDLVQLPAGPLAMAFGGEYRRRASPTFPITISRSATGNGHQFDAGVRVTQRRIGVPGIQHPRRQIVRGHARGTLRRLHGQRRVQRHLAEARPAMQPPHQWLVRGTLGQAYRAPSLFETTPATQTGYSSAIRTRCSARCSTRRTRTAAWT